MKRNTKQKHSFDAKHLLAVRTTPGGHLAPDPANKKCEPQSDSTNKRRIELYEQLQRQGIMITKRTNPETKRSKNETVRCVIVQVVKR